MSFSTFLYRFSIVCFGLHGKIVKKKNPTQLSPLRLTDGFCNTLSKCQSSAQCKACEIADTLQFFMRHFAQHRPKSTNLNFIQLNLILFIFRAHKRFKTISPEKVNHDKNAKLSMVKMINGIAELSCNPFADRICHVFSSAGDGSGDCTFEDYLDMMSVFSDSAPKSVKAEHAFRIFDFDGDDMLSKNDLRQVIQRLIGDTNQFSDMDMEQLITNLLEEADLDDDGSLSFAEFEHVIDKSSDFTK